MASEGKQAHGAVLNGEASDLRVKDNIAADQSLAVAHKASLVGRLESGAKQQELIARLDRASEGCFIDTHQAHESIGPMAQRVQDGSQLGTSFKLEHSWHNRAAWDVTIAPELIILDLFDASNQQWRLGKDNAINLADGPPVRNEGINGLGVMQAGIGIDAIER